MIIFDHDEGLCEGDARLLCRHLRTRCADGEILIQFQKFFLPHMGTVGALHGVGQRGRSATKRGHQTRQRRLVVAEKSTQIFFECLRSTFFGGGSDMHTLLLSGPLHNVPDSVLYLYSIPGEATYYGRCP